MTIFRWSPPTLRFSRCTSWRLAALDKWRGDADGRIAVLESDVVTEKEARLLREALAKHGQLRLTALQRWAGIAVGAVAVADLVRGFFS